MRRLPPEPIPVYAPVSRRLAWAGIGLAALSIGATRFGGIPFNNGLFLMGTAILLGVLAVACAVLAFASIWRTGAPGAGIAIRGLLLAGLLLAWPAWLAAAAIRLPMVNEATTDPADPPSFSRSRAALDARQGHVPPEFERRDADESADVGADLRPIVIEQPAEEAMLLAQRAATNLGWQVIDTASPLGRASVGRIDALARSLIFRFPDDITIRLRPGIGETRIDLRSASRVGRHDFGANARHIRDFAREIETLANAR
jgi:uncharacterized protein (DUF1499 family)